MDMDVFELCDVAKLFSASQVFRSHHRWTASDTDVCLGLETLLVPADHHRREWSWGQEFWPYILYRKKSRKKESNYQSTELSFSISGTLLLRIHHFRDRIFFLRTIYIFLFFLSCPAIGLAPHLFGIKPITFSSLNFPWMKCIALENMYVLLHRKKLYNTRYPDLSAIVMIIEKRPNLLSEKLTSNNVNWSVRRTAVNNLRWCSRFVWGIRINGIVRAETSLLVFFRKPECDVNARYCFTCT